MKFVMGAKKLYKRRIRRFHYLPYLLVKKPNFPFDNVFVIGTNKTATTSANYFLSDCGLRHLSINAHVKHKYFMGRFDYLLKLTQHFNSFDDLPWNQIDVIAFLMRQDADYRFILTLRNADDWFDSLVRFNKNRGRMIPEESSRSMLQKRQLFAHNEACRILSKKFQKPLLEVDITRDTRANVKIADFLGLKSLDIPPMPHLNRTLP